MTKPLRLPQFLGYATGDAANNLAFSMSSMFLLLYLHRRRRHLEAAAVGTMFLLVRFWDAFADIFAGRLVDRTSTRWGKFRPFLLFGSLPLLLLSVAVFSVPDGLSEGEALVYAYVSYAILGLAYSLVNIPYGSMATAMTQRPEERAKLATFRVFGSNLTILMLALVVAPQIKGSDDLQQSLTTTTLVFVVVGFALYLFTFLTAQEQVERDVAEGHRAPDHRHAQAEPAAAPALPVAAWRSWSACSRCRRSASTTPATCSATPTTTSSSRSRRPPAPSSPRRSCRSSSARSARSRATSSFGAVAIVAGIGLARRPGVDAGHRLHLLLRDRHRPGRRQHADVGARGRHGRVRRVEDRHPHGGHHLRAVLLHPQDGPGRRRRRRRVHDRLRRLRRRVRRPSPTRRSPPSRSPPASCRRPSSSASRSRSCSPTP